MKHVFSTYGVVPERIGSRNSAAVVINVNQFNERSARNFTKLLSKAHQTGQSVVPVIVDSYGGQICSLLTMISAIEHSEIPVATICVGKAMSAGAVLLSAGTPGLRFIDRYATVMVHEMSASTWGKTAEMVSTVEFFKRTNNDLFRMFDRKCGKKRGYFLKKLHANKNNDLYFSAYQARREGIVDHIRVPTLVTRIASKTELV